MFVNVKQLIESGRRQEIRASNRLKQALSGQEAKKFLEEMGLDPLKDIETRCGSARPARTRTDMKALLVIVHGKFDPDKLFKAAEAATKKDGDKFSIDQGRRRHDVQVPAGPGQPGLRHRGGRHDHRSRAPTRSFIADRADPEKDAAKAPISADLTALVKKHGREI